MASYIYIVIISMWCKPTEKYLLLQERVCRHPSPRRPDNVHLPLSHLTEQVWRYGCIKCNTESFDYIDDDKWTDLVHIDQAHDYIQYPCAIPQ